MEHDYKIYLHDLQLRDNPSIDRRKPPTIQQILYDIAPTYFSKHITLSTTPSGYLITHAADLDLNYIYNPTIVNKLSECFLKAVLSKNINYRRQIVIPAPPPDIFFTPEPLLIKEIESKNQIKILTLKKLDSDKTFEKYFFITLDSVQSSTNIIDKRSIILFDTQLTAERPRIPKQKTRNTSTYSHQHQGSYTNYGNQQGSLPNYNNYNNQNNQVLPLNYQAGTSSNTLQGSYITYSDQGRI